MMTAAPEPVSSVLELDRALTFVRGAIQNARAAQFLAREGDPAQCEAFAIRAAEDAERAADRLRSVGASPIADTLSTKPVDASLWRLFRRLPLWTLPTPALCSLACPSCCPSPNASTGSAATGTRAPRRRTRREPT